MWRALIPYGLFRLALWFAAVAIALFPTVRTVGLNAVWEGNLFAAANGHGHFRDVLFALVPAGAVSLTTTLDHFCAHRRSGVGLLPIAGLLISILILISGVAGFLVIPDNAVVEPLLYDRFTNITLLGLFLSAIIEVWASGATEKRRTIDERNASQLRRIRSQFQRLKQQTKKRRM